MVVCNTSEDHSTIVRVASIFMVIWPIGVPVLYTMVLLKARRPILARMQTTITKRTEFLHRDYRPEVGK